MKFKDAYRRKNDGVHVRESLLDEIRAADVEQVRAERQKKDRRRPWMIAVPAFAAAAAMFVAVFVGIRAGKLNRGTTGKATYQEASVPAAVESYEELATIMRARNSNGGSRYESGAMWIEDAAVAPTDAEMPAPNPASE